jgi:hypothetical protein
VALFTKPSHFSPDGRYLVYHTLTPKNGYDLHLLPLTGNDRKPIPFLANEFNHHDARVSRDSKWIAYRSDETGTWEAYVQRFPQGGDKFRVSTRGAGGYPPTGMIVGWTDDELIYIAPDLATVMAVDVKTEPTFSAGVPRTLFRVASGSAAITMTPDGERFLDAVPAGRPAALYVVTNWTAALDDR